MNQTSWIASFLFIGFIVFITIRGELPAYKDAIFGGETTTAANAASTAASTVIGDILGHVL